MVPTITVELSVCPDGNDGDVSYGGTASDSGGRAGPTDQVLARDRHEQRTTARGDEEHQWRPRTALDREADQEPERDDRHPDRARDVGPPGDERVRRG
jgi:hypothetical protein